MARRLPPLNALRAFEASARLGSFVAAAGELRVSAAAVSQQVRRLEQYLDTTLFQRLARGLVLTETGRDYLPELSAGFDLLGESTVRLRARRADGVLTITTLAAFANGWLLPRLHRFRERAPRIDVVLRTSRQVMDFRRDAIDLAIRFAPSPGRGLSGEVLCREELFPVASPQLFRGGRMPDTLAALADYPLLHDIDAGPEQPWLGWRGWFERAGLPTGPVTRGPQFSDSVVLVGAAVAGLGIAIGRAPHVGPLLARGQLVRVTQENWISPWSYFLMAPPAHFKRPVVRTFVDWALEEARSDSAAN
jgi:LysR family transcriptional regulator, glycine cleavage system transcriptional activator